MQHNGAVRVQSHLSRILMLTYAASTLSLRSYNTKSSNNRNSGIHEDKGDARTSIDQHKSSEVRSENYELGLGDQCSPKIDPMNRPVTEACYLTSQPVQEDLKDTYKCSKESRDSKRSTEIVKKVDENDEPDNPDSFMSKFQLVWKMTKKLKNKPSQESCVYDISKVRDIDGLYNRNYFKRRLPMYKSDRPTGTICDKNVAGSGKLPSETIQTERKQQFKQTSKLHKGKNKLNYTGGLSSPNFFSNVEIEASNQRLFTDHIESLLQKVLEDTDSKSCKDRKVLENSLRRKVAPPFDSLLRTCAGASKSNNIKVIHWLQELTELFYPQEFKDNFGFNYYLASSLCYGGQVEDGLEELYLLHCQNPQSHKKIKDTTTFITHHLISLGQEQHEQRMLKFVEKVADEFGDLNPALSLWSASFCSPLYRLQQMSEGLLDRYPKLLTLLERKVSGMVKRATWEGDEEALRRLLQLLLHHELTSHYQIATTALLKLQCDLGDLDGAEETLKFSQAVGVVLPAGVVTGLLNLLARNHRPAPRFLLALKYRITSPRSHPVIDDQTQPEPPSPPKYKFKF